MIPKGRLLHPCAYRHCTVPLLFLSTALINYHLKYLMPLPNLIVGNAKASLAIPSPINGKEEDVVLYHAQGQIKQTELMLFSLTLVNQ